MTNSIPVITIDGPSGTGKGTLALRLAAHLGWHYLDSGVLYRALGWAVLDAGLLIDDEVALAALLERVDIKMQVGGQGQAQVFCEGQDVTLAIRREEVGLMASKISSNSMIRKGLLAMQLAARQTPGLVTDGRDMGTVVFVDAVLKLFLLASLKVQAQRRHKQLQQQGINANLAQIEVDLIRRDRRDQQRTLSPTKPAADACVIDTSELSIEQLFDQVLELIEARLN